MVEHITSAPASKVLAGSSAGNKLEPVVTVVGVNAIPRLNPSRRGPGSGQALLEWINSAVGVCLRRLECAEQGTVR